MSKHADIVNEQYNHKESNFVSLQTRITEAFKLAPKFEAQLEAVVCLLYTSPSPRDSSPSRMPSSA